MTFKAIVGIVLGAMLANNYALEKFLGAAPARLVRAGEEDHRARRVCNRRHGAHGADRRSCTDLRSGQAVSGYLQTLVFAAIVLIVIYAMNAVAKAAFKKTSASTSPSSRSTAPCSASR